LNPECPLVDSPVVKDVPKTVDCVEDVPIVEHVDNTRREPVTPKVANDTPQSPPRATLQDSIWAVKGSVEEPIKGHFP